MEYLTNLVSDSFTAATHPLFLAQIAAVIVSGGVAWLLKILITRRFKRVAAYRTRKKKTDGVITHFFLRVAPPLFGPLFFLVGLKVGTVVLERFDIPFILLESLAKLVLVWLIVRLVGLIAGDTVMVRTIGMGLWVLAALSIIGLLEPTAELLEGMRMTVGKVKISALDTIKGIIALIVLMWLAGVISDASEKQIQNQKAMRSASRALVVKLVRVIAYSLAVILALSVMGIDLTALAVFGGALGVGIGLGLQKVVANFVGGVILLAEKSITPGDYIEYNGVTGKVKFLGVRFVCLDTMDGKEHIIPNEELITKPVINWSRVDPQVRGEIMLPIAHGQAFPRVKEVLLQCCKEVERVLDDPEPLIFIKRLTHYAMEVDLKFWIADADQGLGGIRTELTSLILQRFEEKGIKLATLTGTEGLLLSVLQDGAT